MMDSSLSPLPPHRTALTNGTEPPPGVIYSDPEESELSLRDVFEILWRGKWFILVAVVVVFTLTAVHTYRQDRVYESTAVLYVNSQNESPQVSEVLGVPAGSRNIANEVEILKSASSAKRVAEALLSMSRYTANLNKLPVLHTDSGKLPSVTQLGQRIKGRVTVNPVGATVDLIKIKISSTSPEEAQLLANLYAETYRDFNRKSSRSQATASREFLDEITGQFSSDLRQTENQLTSFLDQKRIVQPDEEARQLLEQVMKLNSLQSQSQLEMGVAQAEVRSLEAEIADLTPRLAAQASSSEYMVVDELKRRIAGLEVEEQQIYASNPDARNAPRTRRLTEIEQEKAELRAQLDQRVSQLVERSTSGRLAEAAGAGPNGTAGVFGPVQELQGKVMAKKMEIEALQTRLDILNRQLDSYKARLAQIPENALVLQRLQRSQTAQEQLYLTLLEKMQEARIAEQSELGYIEIIDEAMLPGGPVSPRIPQNLAFGAIFGLLVGVGLAFLRHAFDNTLRKPEDLQKQGFNMLGVIPDLKGIIKGQFGSRKWVEVNGRTYATSLIPLFNPQSQASEEYRRLRTNIHFSRPNPDIRTIIVTSASPGEGKTVTSVNLATAIAQSGRKTLYLEADLRLPTGHDYFGLEREPGLTDLVEGRITFDPASFQTPIDNLYLIPAGHPVTSPNDVLGCSRMRELLAIFREHFDVIILDTPPVLAVADVLLLAPMIDVTLLVCSAKNTNRPALTRATEALQKVGAHIGGIVLNRFDAQHAYGYGSYAYAYEEYGRSHSKKYWGRRGKQPVANA